MRQNDTVEIITSVLLCLFYVEDDVPRSTFNERFPLSNDLNLNQIFR